MGGAVFVAKGLQYHAKVLQEKYKKCLDNHIKEEEQRLEKERHERELREQSLQRTKDKLENSYARLKDIRLQLSHAEGQMDEINTQFGWAKYHRERVMEEYRKAWYENPSLKLK